MEAILITLYIWVAVGLLVATLLVIFGIKFLRKGRKYAKEQELLLKKVELRTKKEYNKIAMLPPTELAGFLSVIFGQCLELQAAAYISSKDPLSVEKLYGESLARLKLYLGEETEQAIDYYYGHDYVGRWSLLAFRILENRGMLSRIINKEITAEAVSGTINRVNQKLEG